MFNCCLISVPYSQIQHRDKHYYYTRNHDSAYVNPGIGVSCLLSRCCGCFRFIYRGLYRGFCLLFSLAFSIVPATPLASVAAATFGQHRASPRFLIIRFVGVIDYPVTIRLHFMLGNLRFCGGLIPRFFFMLNLLPLLLFLAIVRCFRHSFRAPAT